MKSIPVLACLLVLCGLGAAAGEPAAADAVVDAAADAAAAHPAVAGPAAADTLRGSPGVASPVAVLAAFERAWLAGASDSVLACMSPRSIELALRRTGPPGGHFPPSQAGFLIEDLLHYGGTRECRVIRFEWQENSPPEAEIAWTHLVGGEEVRERLVVQLALEDGAWRVVRVAAH